VAALVQLAQYNQLIQYWAYRLIIISQAIGEKRIPKLISSGRQQFKCLGMVQTDCHWRVMFIWIIQLKCLLYLLY